MGLGGMISIVLDRSVCPGVDDLFVVGEIKGWMQLHSGAIWLPFVYKQCLVPAEDTEWHLC